MNCTGITKDEPLWINLTDIVLREISQTKISYDSIYTTFKNRQKTIHGDKRQSTGYL